MTDKIENLIQRQGTPKWRIADRLIVLLVLCFAVWAWFAKLDQVTTATGEVIPQGKIKQIQHLEGGIIIKLPVSEGALVKVGDPLVELDLATAGINREEILAHLDALILTRARLLAESQRTRVVFPEDIARARPSLVEAEKQTMQARRKEYESALEVARKKVTETQQQIAELRNKLKTLRKNLSLAKRELEIVEDLYDQGLETELNFINISQRVEGLQGEIKGTETGIIRTQAILSQTQEQVKQVDRAFTRAVREEMNQVEREINQLKESLERADEQKGRAIIRSPIDGVVKQMRYHTIGGVVSPGEPIMEIVPTTGNLVIEAQLNPTDRGYVREGQRADVKITAYDFVRYGSLKGRVEQIAADTLTSGQDPNGNPLTFYQLIVSTDKSYLGDTPDQLPITPGMQAMVDVHIGEQSVWEYLIRPVLKMKYEAFREP